MQCFLDLKKLNLLIHGGCDIGSRPIDLHLSSFKKLGIKINENSGNICCTCDKIKDVKPSSENSVNDYRFNADNLISITKKKEVDV